MDMPGFGQRMFEDARESECLTQEGRWAAQGVLKRFWRTPHGTMQRDEEIAKKAAKGYFKRHPSSEMKYRWTWGCDGASMMVMSRLSVEMAVKLAGLMDEAADLIGWGTHYVGDMVEEWLSVRRQNRNHVHKP